MQERLIMLNVDEREKKETFPSQCLFNVSASYELVFY